MKKRYPTEKIIFTICLILIMIAILVAVGFYAWSEIEKQAYFERQELKSEKGQRKTLEEIFGEFKITD